MPLFHCTVLNLEAYSILWILVLKVDGMFINEMKARNAEDSLLEEQPPLMLVWMMLIRWYGTA
jgi:hypothetical protein